MKKLAVLFLLLSAAVFAQANYVPVDNYVYSFLERMESQHIISNYNSFELPKTRRDIAGYLKQIMRSPQKLDPVDKGILEDLKIEFEFELYGTLNDAQSLIGKGTYDLFSQKEKYLYFYNNPSKMNLFINLLAQGEGIYQLNTNSKKSINTPLINAGGEIRGTIIDKIGFSIRGTNGIVFGNREAARLRKDISYNFKFNSLPDETFFDETAGYISADFNYIKFKLGRDRLTVGYGPVKSVVGDNSPLFDYLALEIKYKFFSFSYFHGKILGYGHYAPDPVTDGVEVIEDKFLGYHRIGFNLSDDADFGIGEMIVYGGRSIDLTYVNPFNFYKSAEHANRDRDNSMLFFDFNNKSIKGLKLYSTLLIDDINFGKFGTGWFGNQTMFNAGFYSSNLYKILPLDFQFEYTRISPYTYTHRLIGNNFTNFGYTLGAPLQPNSELFFSQLNYRFSKRLNFSVSYSYTLHGANPLNADGSVARNVGGNISLGHRTFDSESTSFLDGDMEYLRNASALLVFEPVNQMFLSFKLAYANYSKQNGHHKYLRTFFNLSLRL